MIVLSSAMDAKTILAALGRVTRIGRRVVHHEQIDSTNTRALEELRAGDAEDGIVHVADRQTAGRGSGGKAWVSGDGLGLSFSVVLDGTHRSRPLPFLPAVAVADALREHGVDAHVKWPNDVLVADRKIAGILIEAVLEGAKRAWVIGVGINVNQAAFPEEVDAIATSMRRETGREFARAEILADVLRRMDRLEEDGADLAAAFRQRCRMPGRWIEASRDGVPSRVLVRDIDADGHLVVENEAGTVTTWVSATDLDIATSYGRSEA